MGSDGFRSKPHSETPEAAGGLVQLLWGSGHPLEGTHSFCGAKRASRPDKLSFCWVQRVGAGLKTMDSNICSFPYPLGS